MQQSTSTLTVACILALYAGSAGAGAPDATAASQAGPASESAREYTQDRRLSLSAAQERTIYQSVVNADRQALPQSTPLIVGTMVPKSMKLNDLPRNVTQQVGSVAPYQYVKLEDDKLLLVDPTNRVVAGIITANEGSLGDRKPASSGRVR